MITYQDLLKAPSDEKSRAEFVRQVISKHQASELYVTAKTADDYDRCRNTTITNYQKMITKVTGQMVPDKWSATHRSASNFFNIFTTQLNQYLLGNGVTWANEYPDGPQKKKFHEPTEIEQKLGKDFDTKLQMIGKYALCAGVAFGFWNLDHVVAFSALEFAPLYDEETGKLSAGVRFWQIDSSKPLRATLYEPDGCQDYMFTSKDIQTDGWTKLDGGAYYKEKTPYSWVTVGDEKDRADGTEELLPGAPVNGFPIIPMYPNIHHQSELVNLRSKIDAYDFILNGYEDDLDNAQIYWIIHGAGGMDDLDLQQFLERLKTVKAAAPGDGQDVQPVQVEIPYNARETLLQRIEKQLYRDAMIMNPEDIASGATTATQIRAAYERQNVKADQYEYGVLEFLGELMNVAEIDDEPSFTRSTIVNVQEEVQTVLSAASFLTDDYVTIKVLTILGDGDKAGDIIASKSADELNNIRITDTTEEEIEETE